MPLQKMRPRSGENGSHTRGLLRYRIAFLFDTGRKPKPQQIVLAALTIRTGDTKNRQSDGGNFRFPCCG